MPNSVVVRRDYEFIIDEIADDGSFTGVAIISPSPKADADYAANGSYKLKGKIDFRTGAIELQGNEWIDYPLGYDNFTFVKLNGQLDIGPDTPIIDGISENGIWSMSTIDYTTYTIQSGFELGEDNNSFPHYGSSVQGSGFYNVKNYKLSSDYYKALTKDSSKGEKNQIQKSMDEEWEGSCYGIASTMGLVYENYLNLSDINSSSATSYYKMKFPCNDEKLLNTINYYQLSQSLENGGKQDAAVSAAYNHSFFADIKNWRNHYDSLSGCLRLLVKYASNNHVELLGFSTKEGGHAILVTGCHYNEEKQQYELQLYDENTVQLNGANMGEFSVMTISKDYSQFSFKENGTTVSNSNFCSIYFLDWNGMKNLVNRTKNDLNTSHAKIDFDFNGGAFKLTNSNGKYLFYDGTKLSGTMNVYGLETIDSDDGCRLSVETDKNCKFVMSNLESSVDLEVASATDFLSVEGTNITGGTLNLGQGMELKGSNYTFEAFVSTDGQTENGLVSVSGKAADTVELIKEKDHLNVKSDAAINNVITTAYEDVNKKENTITTPVRYIQTSGAGTVKSENEHTWGEWVVKKEATVFVKGYKERVCTVCGEKETQDIPKLTPTMKINAKSIPLQVGQSTKKVKVTGLANGDSVSSWKSGSKLVTVDQNGKIKAGKKTGKAIITVTLKSGLSKKITVKVQKNPVTTQKIKVAKSSITLKKGKSSRLTPVITPITSTSKISHASSNTKVVTVSQKGKIVAKKKGKAVITVKSGNKKVKVKVTVK